MNDTQANPVAAGTGRTAAVPRRAAIVCLRSEYKVSGEHKSTLALVDVLRECGVQARLLGEATGPGGALRWRNLFDPGALARQRAALARERFDLVFVKIPTLAQIGFASALARAVEAPVVVLLDGLCAGTASRGRVWLELRHEPGLATLKRIANHPAWARLRRRHPLAVVTCAQCQLDDARSLLGAGLRGAVIPNASPADEPAAGPPAVSAGYTVGYLGHAYAFKGCVDLIGARARLPADRRPRFVAAFSESGAASVRRAWLDGGGTDVGVTNATAFMRSTDLLCVPLHTEFGTKVYPNVLLEAMRCRVPVLTTRSRVSEALFGSEPPFPLLERVDPESIATGIMTFRRLDRERVAEHLHTRFNAFSRSVVRDRWARFIQDLFAND